MATQYTIPDLDPIALEDVTDSHVVEIAISAGVDSERITLGTLRSSLVTTDAVTSAGALMDSELESIADVKALDQSVVNGASPVFDASNMTNIPATDPSGSDTQVQYNNSGAFGASAGFTYSNGAVLEAQDAGHKPLIVNSHASQSVNVFEINGPGGSNGSFWRFLNTGVIRAGTNGDFSQPVYQFGNSNNGLYLDSNRIFIKAGGAFAGGFSSIGYQGNSALMDTIVSLDNLTSPRFIGYRLSADGLKAGLGGNSSGDASIITNNVARITAYAAGGINVPGLPTSAAGLATGDLWNDSGTLKVA